MRRLLVLGIMLMGIIALPASPSAAEQGETLEVRLGSDVWPPFTDRPGRRRVAIELVEKALLRGGVTATSEIRASFGEVLDDLRSGALDGSAAVWHTPERERFLRFSRPYLENRLVLLARRGTPVNATNLSQLEDKRVGIVSGYAYQPSDPEPSPTLSKSDIRAGTGPEFIEGPSDQENLMRLLRGDIEYMLADELVIHEFFERHGERAHILLAAGTTGLIRRSLHFALRRDHPHAQSIIERFDGAIREMIADGSFNRALGLTWLHVDLDGDGESELVVGGTQAGTAEPGEGYALFEKQSKGASEDSSSGYVVGGKRYGTWGEIPSKFKVPIDADRDVARPEPTIRLMEF